MGFERTKKIHIYVPLRLLSKMSWYRGKTGVSVTHQLCVGAGLFLEKQEKKPWPIEKVLKLLIKFSSG